ncbi:GTP cyclohydrolase N terminal-domain-containing protein [Xylaria sp. CBS 124048]|nr:GTP cyclohydrolase N terminal-domain-containing protein [Xylaria sp. CBS 124048]
MATPASGTGDLGSGTADILRALKAIEESQSKLAAEVESVSQRLDTLAPSAHSPHLNGVSHHEHTLPGESVLPQAAIVTPSDSSSAKVEAEKAGFSSRIILTTYPKQLGINPIPLNWGAPVDERGPVVVSRSSSTIRKRNAHGGSYSIYFALALASKQLNVNHRPDFTNTEPAANIGPFPQWTDKKKIVAMDPWGHLAPWQYANVIQKENVDIRPTIAVTKAHMKLPELEESVRSGRLVPDGKVCLNATGELAVTKFAVEPVWYLPGVAERFGIDEGVLRRSLFEHTGGSYPELITRNDMKVFLPPIGGLTVYCFGDPAKMSDEKVRLSLRIHDECNGSDVFGSDICTCRPYLIYGIEEAVKEAQNGGSGVVIYFRKEGRALGEVTKVFVYNARKRGEDRASDYFKRTENVAGVKDMRFQALMPDILHWLGIKKIDRMLSMSDMKHDAIVGQGIPIHERVELPEELIPADSRVEIDAKITAGYFTTGHRMTQEELSAVKGRMWDDIDH